jgi:hypothetical protein
MRYIILLSALITIENPLSLPMTSIMVIAAVLVAEGRQQFTYKNPIPRMSSTIMRGGSRFFTARFVADRSGLLS